MHVPRSIVARHDTRVGHAACPTRRAVSLQFDTAVSVHINKYKHILIPIITNHYQLKPKIQGLQVVRVILGFLGFDGPG